MSNQEKIETEGGLHSKINIFMIFILAMFLVGFVSADSSTSGTSPTLGNYPIYTAVNITQICSNATYVNISIFYPNSTTAVTNVPMTSDGGGLFHYLFTQTNSYGTYNIPGISDGCQLTFSTSFTITPPLGNITQGQSGMYVLIFVICFLIFLGLLMMGIYLPSNNKTDEMTGYVIAKSNTKYLKLICLGLAYVFLVFLSYFSWMVSYSYLSFDFLSSILQFCFYFLAICTLPLFILFLYIVIANAVRDNKVAEMLARGLRFKE